MKQKERSVTHVSKKPLRKTQDRSSAGRDPAAIRESSEIEEQLNGRMRVVIEGVDPEVDCGRFPVKRVIGDCLTVEADVFTDGHDAISVVLRHRREEDADWQETAMTPLVNDRWRAAFSVSQMGEYRYTLQAWIDPFKSWQQSLLKKFAAGQEIALDLKAGAGLIGRTAQKASSEEREALQALAAALIAPDAEPATIASDPRLTTLMERCCERRWAVNYDKELRVSVDRKKAGFSTWYELFPRSCAKQPGKHGTLRDCAARLPYVAGMGFDVLYLPPIHPIGHAFRKGKNGVLRADPHDVGSPWAIGSEDGGHKSILRQLGTLADFQRLLAQAKDYGIEIALDIAFQCTPDHPYVREHPEWFRKRPDGSIQYAENPPKKYQDIYPLDFETEDWQGLWQELKGVLLFWCEQGVRIFRVDNPHTKSFRFWQWVIGEVRKSHPEALFLAEAFTRPKVMYHLAKLGFSQSYTYFAWRNVKWELTQYFTELTRTEVAQYFRPNLWPNTPDILTEYLQFGGRPAFMARVVLAATLGANYGIYGPAFELCRAVAREPGSEEYLDSEKYQLIHWDLENPESLREFIARINRIRRQNVALQSDRSLRFYPVDNDQIVAYSKQTDDLENIILVIVNLDAHNVQSGWLDLPLSDLGLEPSQPFQVHDLLTDARYFWQGARNFVRLDPSAAPAHVFRIRPRLRREQDFDYFM